MKKKMLSLLLASMMAVTMLPVSSFAEELEAEGESDEIVEINMVGLGFFGEGGKEEVMDAINEISEAEIGVHVNYTIMDIQTYMTQVPLMIADASAGLDLIMFNAMPTTSFTTLTAQKQLMDITDYLGEYAPETMELMADYIPATTVGDAIYGMPAYRIYNSSYYIVMRKDVLDELGLTEEAQAIDSWSAYKDLLVKVHDAQDSLPAEMQTNAMVTNTDTQGNVLMGMYVNPAADAFADDYGFDTLGDSNRIIKVNDDGKVENFFASDDYRTCIERTKDFYDADLIYKDAATSQDGSDQQMANGITFSYCVQSEYGVEQAKANATGYEVVCVPYIDVPIQTSNGNTWGWGVPVNSEEPEAAVAFMNLMYTNSEIENLFVYGIEGRDYELNDAGEACLLDTKEYQNSDFFFGNQFNAYPAEGTGSDFREKALEQMLAAEISPYYGCVVDTDPIANTITAIKAVLTKYENGLESGSAPLENLDKMLEELEGAGLQEYMDYYQTSLDEWLAQQ
ncbi:MAG: ABC transporter substrate-binding protein [Blautia sp.]|nr:ABC transporter substrate-binding protein [Blautia sp.]